MPISVSRTDRVLLHQVVYNDLQYIKIPHPGIHIGNVSEIHSIICNMFDLMVISNTVQYPVLKTDQGGFDFLPHMPVQWNTISTYLGSFHPRSN